MEADTRFPFTLRRRGAILLAILTALLALAVAIALVCFRPWLQGFDESVLLALRSGPDLMTVRGPSWIQATMLDLTALGGQTVSALLVALSAVFLLILRKWGHVFFLLAAASGGGLLSTLLKGLVNRPRPSIVPHLVIVDNPSFPSGHSLLSAVIYLSLALICLRAFREAAARRFLIGAAVLVIFLVGISRMYLGVHYPSDVLAGWLGGTAWVFLCWQILAWRERTARVCA